MKYLNAILCVLLPTIACLTTVDADEKMATQIVEKSINAVFRPTAVELEKSTSALKRAITNNCKSDQTLQVFSNTVEIFSTMEFFRLGIVNQNNRAERLFFWPDRKATGQKQMRRLLQDPNRDTLNAEALSQKSVALQGFAALERILSSKNPDEETKNCSVAQAIAINMHNISLEIKQDWFAIDGIATQLSNGSPESLYRSSAEAMTAILTLSENALIVLSEKKLGLIIEGLDNKGSIPKSAPFWRSDMTLRHLDSNLTGIERLLIDSGLATAANTDTQLEFEFRTAHSMLAAATEALNNNDTDTASKRLLAAKLIVDGMSTTVVETIAPALGVVTGFNSSDGD